MPRKKPRATIRIRSSKGEMVELRDQRFEDWPDELTVRNAGPAWLDYFALVCQTNRWSAGGISQVQRTENSGSFSILRESDSTPILDLMWERPRDGSLTIRAKPAADSPFGSGEVKGFLESVTDACRAAKTTLIHKRGYLYYNGRAWRGELWLDQRTRLGPPSKEYEALFGPRVILADISVDTISDRTAIWDFQVALRELSVFLSIIMRTKFEALSSNEWAWTFIVPFGKSVEVDARQIGYIDAQHPRSMPNRGVVESVPLHPVSRPLLSDEIRAAHDDTQEYLPDDVVVLWELLSSLPAALRKQFLHVGTVWQASLALRRQYPSTSLALMASACEALKPTGKGHAHYTVYDVVRTLFGQKQADLVTRPIDARIARNLHFHAAELFGAEFDFQFGAASFADPSFHEIYSRMWRMVPAAMIEWLRRGGSL